MKTRFEKRESRGAGARIALAQDELLLLLLGLLPGKPVNGWNVLERELRLLCEELAAARVRCLPPGRGDLTLLVNLLEMEGYITVKNRRTPTVTKFALTKHGRKVAREIAGRVEAVAGRRLMERLREARIGWDQLGDLGLKRYVEARKIKPVVRPGSRFATIYVVEFTLRTPEGRRIHQRETARFPSYEEAHRHAEQMAREYREQGFKASYNICRAGILL